MIEGTRYPPRMDDSRPPLALIPWPASVDVRAGEWSIREQTRVLLDEHLPDSMARVARGFSTSSQLPTSTGSGVAGDIVWRQLPVRAAEGTETDAENESYRLTVDQGRVVVEAGAVEGFLRAEATLRQLGPRFPAIEIMDQPSFPWRGLLLDCSRHFVPVDRIHRLLEQLAEHKMNRFHWHLTDDQGWRLAVEAYPRLAEVAAWRRREDGAYGGCYDPDDVRDVVRRAQELGITVVPEIELPGHSTAALAAYPELACTDGPFEVETEWGVFDDVYCAGKDETLRFLERVFEQVLEQFPGVYVHVGGDECPKTRWKDCARCQQRIRDEGLRDEDHLQTWFVDHFGRFLSERNRRFIGWDEILAGGLPPGAIVQSWQGVKGAVAAARAGHDTVVSPMSHCYLDFNLAHLDLRRAYEFDPVPPELGPDEVHHVLGGECNLWTERAPPEKLDERIFPRMLATAERLWTGSGQTFPDFEARLDLHQPRLEARGVRFGEREDPGYNPDDRFDWSLP